MKVKILEQLENLLAHWEDLCDMAFFAATTKEAFPDLVEFDLPVDLPLQYARTLRHYILKSEDEDFNYERYMYGKKPEFRDKWRNWSEAFYFFPASLFHWCRSSRRVYQMSDELMNLLLLTKVDDVLWGDLRFPFTCFIVEFENGFTDAGGHVHNFMMVELVIINGIKKLIISSIARKEGLFPLIPTFKFVEMRSALNHRQYSKLHKIAEVINEKYADCESAQFVAPFVVENGETIRQIVDKGEQNMLDLGPSGDQIGLASIAMQAMRVVCGFALYLQMQPSGSPHVGDWQPITTKVSKNKAVTDKAMICAITSSVKLTLNEIVLIREQVKGMSGRHEVRVHFREGHWRRPPGKGDDPTAIKTVWVKPTIVRRDKLEPGTLPVGLVEKLGPAH